MAIPGAVMVDVDHARTPKVDLIRRSIRAIMMRGNVEKQTPACKVDRKETARLVGDNYQANND